MKTAQAVYKSILITGLAVAALAWLPASAPAQEMKGAEKLMKIQTVKDVQKLEAGDTIVMSCPKCKETYTHVVVKSRHAVTADELKTTGTHLCPSCDTKLVTQGVGKEAKEVLVHTCKVCGSEDVMCCVMKKGSHATKGMEEK